MMGRVRGDALAGRIALVTGAGRGIGAEIAREFARQGADLVLSSRTPSELEAVGGDCRLLGSECEPVRADVGRLEDVEELVTSAVRRFGRIDVLVNAAAVIGAIGRLHETSPEDWEATVRTNLFGTVNTSRCALPSMLAAGSGVIVNFSGGGAASPLANLSAYAVSKAAVVRLTDTLAEEVRDVGVMVYAVAPGMVDTGIHDPVLAAGPRAGAQYDRSAQLRDRQVPGISAGLVSQLVLFLVARRPAALSGRLISVAHDPWRRWEKSGSEALDGTAWYTLRRVDPHTVGELQEVPL
jgi:3-oxoacyl-[acyl-carrier protein] reductase